MNKKSTIKVNLLALGIVALVIAILYVFIGIYFIIEFITLQEWGIVMLVEGIILECIGFGLFTKCIIPNKKGAFLYGLLLGIIGIIIAVCIKHKKNTYQGNKYEDLEKLQRLKEEHIITDTEFEIQKSKLLR